EHLLHLGAHRTAERGGERGEECLVLVDLIEPPDAHEVAEEAHHRGPRAHVAEQRGRVRTYALYGEELSALGGGEEIVAGRRVCDQERQAARHFPARVSIATTARVGLADVDTEEEIGRQQYRCCRELEALVHVGQRNRDLVAELLDRGGLVVRERSPPRTAA